MKFSGAAWCGVDLFFVLSGFLITGILYDAKHAPHYFRNFYARRVLRIFPLYYGFLVAVVLLIPLVPRFARDTNLGILVHHQTWYWTYTFNWWVAREPLFLRGPYSNLHLWSLAVEEQFYLVWPAVVLLLNWRNLKIVCVLCFAAAIALRWTEVADASPFAGTQFFNPFAAYFLAPARMDAFAVGAFLALVFRAPVDKTMLTRRASLAAATALATLLALLWVRGDLLPLDPWVQTVGYSSMAILFGSTIVLVLVAPPPALLHRLSNHNVAVFFGRYSYGIYVVHWMVGMLLIRRLTVRDDLPLVFGSQIPSRIVFSVVGISISVAVAWLSWHLVEQRFLKLKRYFPAASAREPVVDAAAS